MEELLRYLPVVSILATGAMGWLMYKLGDKFVAKGEAITPLQLQNKVNEIAEKFDKKLEETFEKFRLAVVDQINTKISTNGTENMLRYDSVDRRLGEMFIVLSEIRQKVEKVDTDAVNAKHGVDLISERMEGHRTLMESRLRLCEDQLERRQNERRET